jgi:hypothetical protein
MVPLTVATHFWDRPTPTGSMPDRLQHERDPTDWQRKLELLEEN